MPCSSHLLHRPWRGAYQLAAGRVAGDLETALERLLEIQSRLGGLDRAHQADSLAAGHHRPELVAGGALVVAQEAVDLIDVADRHRLLSGHRGAAARNSQSAAAQLEDSALAESGQQRQPGD